MSELAIVAASMKVRLLEISKQANALATGLQNAAPGALPSASADKMNVPNKSVQYLYSVAEMLAELADKCDKNQKIEQEQQPANKDIK